MPNNSQFNTRCRYRGIWQVVADKVQLRHDETITPRTVAARYRRNHLATVLLVHETKQEMDNERLVASEIKHQIEGAV